MCFEETRLKQKLIITAQKCAAMRKQLFRLYMQKSKFSLELKQML